MAPEPKGKRTLQSEKGKVKVKKPKDKESVESTITHVYSNYPGSTVVNPKPSKIESKYDRYTMVTVEMNLPVQFGLGKGVMGGRFLLKHPLEQKHADTIDALVPIMKLLEKNQQITPNLEDDTPWPIQRDIAARLFGSFDAMSDRHYAGKDQIPLLVWQGYFTDEDHDETKILGRMAKSQKQKPILISESYYFDLKYTK